MKTSNALFQRRSWFISLLLFVLFWEGCQHDRHLLKDSPTYSPLDTLLLSRCWVAYSPTNYNPETGVEPSEESLRADLQQLHNAGFDGLVTYGANGRIPQLAEAAGFQGMLFGVWDPNNAAEMALAKEAAKEHIVSGFVIGNEGLDVRYTFEELKNAIAEIKEASGKPVTTTEEMGDYGQKAVMELGDWVFPNVHPYFANQKEASDAVHWTMQQFEIFRANTTKPVLFKEVGLPTSGDPEMNETKQADYYCQLRQTSVKFVWFEAYDQAWKRSLPIEPHWGLFTKDRVPKEVIRRQCVCR